MRRLAVFGLILVEALAIRPASAQDRPEQGVVWTPPPNVRQAERELRDMRARGIEAVRTLPVRDTRLLTLADTIGLRFYQDLPMAYLSAQALADTLSYARRQLGRLLGRAQGHPSARHFGIARLSDTSDPAACTSIRRLAEFVRERGPSGSRTYYMTPFVAADQCATQVDAVLLDARNADLPFQSIAAWQSAHPETPVGVGALGTWVRRDGRQGVRVSHSPEAQARYLERHLGHLLTDTVSAVPSAVFVYRWRDRPDTLRSPYGRAYGLHAADGSPRPAVDVVAGFYTGKQTVFAFSAGQASPGSAPWLILLGWGLIALLAVIYFREPRLRHTMMRYFLAHRFYQEAIEEGREVLVGSSMALLGGGVLGMGMLGVVLGRCFQNAQSVIWALSAMPTALQSSLAPLMDQPWSLGVVLAAGYVVSLVLWIGGLTLVGQYGPSSITAGQAVMIVGWPCWPMLLVMVAAMVISTFAPENGRALVLWLMSITGGLAVWMTGRTLTDFAAVARIPGVLAAVTVLVSPLFFLLWVSLFLITRHDVPLSFIWHLLART